MEKLYYKLEKFEGPLDLLLFLIRKNKLNICDISISELVDQYLEQINVMQENNMEITSEFLDMAARLVYMKTVSLLPKPEESEKLKSELTGELLEYQECRRIAGIIGRNLSFDSFPRAAQKIEFGTAYCGHNTPQEIHDAYVSAVGRGKRLLPPKPEAFSGIVSHKIVSVASRIVHILRRLLKHGKECYEELYSDCRHRSDIVATFLAVLELIKSRRIRLEGEHDSTVRLLGRKHVKRGAGQ